jgi:hypothetical protein
VLISLSAHKRKIPIKILYITVLSNLFFLSTPLLSHQNGLLLFNLFSIPNYEKNAELTHFFLMGQFTGSHIYRFGNKEVELPLFAKFINGVL